MSAPGLGLLGYTKSFNLYVRECEGIANGVLKHNLGPHQTPFAYYSVKLASLAAGGPA